MSGHHPVPSQAEFARKLANQRGLQQDSSTDTGMVIVAYLVAGVGFYGGLGWAIDQFWLHSGWLLPVGVLVGMAMSIYLVVRKYGPQASEGSGR